MTDQLQQTKPDEHRYYPEDEIELMDYLLVIWKWKYMILAGTLAFVLAAGIISFITWKQQPQMYRTNIVLKPEILKIDLEKFSFDSLETIKTLIENNLKYKYKVDIPKGSDIINVSLESASVDEGTTKLNDLIKTLLADFPNKVKYVQEACAEKIESNKREIEKFNVEIENNKSTLLNQIEQKKTLLAELKEKESIAKDKYKKEIETKKGLLAELKEKELIAKINFEKTIQIQKNILADMLFEENKLKSEIDNCEQKLLDIESNLKILRGRIDLSSNIKDISENMATQNTYSNASKSYYVEKENAKYNLFKLQRKILEVSKNIEDLEKANDSVQADPLLQPDMYGIQKNIIKVLKEIKNLEKANDSIQADPLLQPDLFEIQKNIIKVSKELEKSKKEENNIFDADNYRLIFQKLQQNIAEISKKIEKLEKEKLNIQNIQVVQPPATTELPKTKSKIKRNIVLPSVMGLFLLLFLSFFLEYISKYKSKASPKSTSKLEKEMSI